MEERTLSSGRGRIPKKYAFVLLWLAVLAVLVFAAEILAPFIGAVLIAYLLAPLVGRLERLKFGKRAVPRWVATLAVLAALVGVVALFFFFSLPRLGSEIGKLARDGERLLASLTTERINQYARDTEDWLRERGIPVQIAAPEVGESGPPRPGIDIRVAVKQSLAEIKETLRERLVDLLSVGPKFAANAFRKVFMAFLILMVAAFLLIDPIRPMRFLESLFPKKYRPVFAEFIREADAGLAGVVRGQVLICLVNGVLTFIGLYFVFHIKFAVMLSILAAVMSLVPIFGSILSSIPIVAIALSGGIGTGLGVLGWIVGIHLVEANFLNPKIMGTAARIHPALVVFALVAGEHFYGIVGALFAVPVAVILIRVFAMFQRRAIAWHEEEA